MSKLKVLAGQFGALVLAVFNLPNEWAARHAARADEAAAAVVLASGCTIEEAVSDLNRVRRQLLSRDWDVAVDLVLAQRIAALSPGLRSEGGDDADAG